MRCPAIRKTVFFLSLLTFAFGSFWFGQNNAKASLPKAEKVVVIKSKRLMMLLKDGEIFKTYRVCLGKQPNGHKLMAGDQRTPEGRYVLDSRNRNSKYHLAIHISYPNESDVVSARKRGVSPGGGIMIHGLSQRLGAGRNASVSSDWTNGCIAVTNAEIEEIWQLVQDGTPIEIKP